jgi:type II secretory pathway component GspD/PulD (secretin)
MRLEKKRGISAWGPLTSICLLAGAAVCGQEQPSRYSGEPLSLNLQNADLEVFLDRIQKISDLKIVLDPTVCRKVTVNLETIPWDQAFVSLLEKYGLTYVLEGNTLRVMTVERTLSEQASETTSPSGRLDKRFSKATSKPTAALVLASGISYEVYSCRISDKWLYYRRACGRERRVATREINWAETNCVRKPPNKM